MEVGKVLTRFRLGLTAFLAVAVFAGVMVASASAAETPPSDASGLGANSSVFDPLETNVPYLAWRGEEVRLVKCIPHLRQSDIGLAPTTLNNGFIFNGGGLDLNMQIYEYSGPQENSFDGPKAVTQTGNIFFDEDQGRICVRGDFISNKPGIVVVKLTLAINGVILGQHDFLIGWMAVNSAAIANSGSVSELPGTLPGNSVNVNVTGSIPLNQEFQDDWRLPATLVLPRDWALWAGAMASTDDYLSWQDPSAFWDIHDSSGPQGNESPDGSPDVHVDPTDCATGTAASLYVDQVDNCDGGESDYSRIFGDLTSGETGPFDPTFSSTLLSDGRLNSSDAPMPALKVILNSDGAMGGFANTCLNDKDNVYNRNYDPTNPVFAPNQEEQEGPYSQMDCIAPNTSETAAHALYAPYYSQYIPATSRDPFGPASGVDGPIYSDNTGQPNNFNGFQWYGQYENWEIAREIVSNQAQDTPCLLRERDYQDVFRQSNNLPTRVMVFTDEHGEARLSYVPETGNDNFGDTVGFVDDNGGCDLEGVDLGSSTITASVRYPYQPVGVDIAATGSITKNILNGFHKSVTCVRKVVAGTAIAYICTVSATDITGGGEVFNGEHVCLSREPENVWFPVGGGRPQPNGYCVVLSGGDADSPATATAETPATLVGSQIDVQAFFIDEHLLRDTCITVGQSPSTPGPCGAVGGGGTTTSGTTSGTTGGTTSGTTGTTEITTHGDGALLPKAKGGKAKASVASVQLVLNKNGTRVLMVKIRSSKATAKIQIRLINAKGKVITRVVRVVKTNKRVAVSNLRVSKQVKTVRVKVVG